MQEKHNIVKDAILLTSVKIKTSGEKFSDAYLVLSNNYIYSYPLVNSVNPEIKLFIKDAIIEDLTSVLKWPTLHIENKFGKIWILFDSGEMKLKW